MTHPHTWDLFRKVALVFAGAWVFWGALAQIAVWTLDAMR